MKLRSVMFLAVFVGLLSSCSKSGSTGNTDTAPTNLVVSAVVTTNNSGNVSFTASANNAVSYDFDYGNGIFQTVTSGIITYKYPVSGTYTVNVIAKSAGGQTISKSIQVTVIVVLTLFWSDEFNTPGTPDPSKWGYDIGTGTGGWGNAELEYYTSRPDNVIVSGGTLKIIAKAESFLGSSYTSARLLTKNKFSFQYGKIDLSAKLPSGVGTWPALWMLGDNISTVGWPNCGEIDIMEHRGSELNKIYGTVHYPGHSGSNGDVTTTVISNAATAFHKYTLEWDPGYIKFSVDDVAFKTFVNSGSLPFNQNLFLILNVAMGGNFGGSVDPAFTSATLEIDYIRVYH